MDAKLKAYLEYLRASMPETIQFIDSSFADGWQKIHIHVGHLVYEFPIFNEDTVEYVHQDLVSWIKGWIENLQY